MTSALSPDRVKAARDLIAKTLEPPKGMDDMTSGTWHYRIADKIISALCAVSVSAPKEREK
jgi:hypothetical protein